MWQRRRRGAAAGLVALAFATGLLGCGPDVTVPLRSPSAAASAVPTSSTAAESTATTSHFSAPGVAFDYPSSWSATPLNVLRHYEDVYGLLGTGHFAEACPSDAQQGQMNTCTEQFSLAPGTVVVKVSVWGLPTPAGQTQAQFEASANPSAVPMTIAGRRGMREPLGEPMSGADEHWRWLVDAPGGAFAIEAWLRGPNLGTLDAQLDALVASMSVTAPAQ